MFRLFKRLALALLILGLLAVVGYLCRAALLSGAANAWIVRQPVAKADLIIVLAGGPETRPFEAARLFQQGIAPRVLLTNPKTSEITKLGLIPAEPGLTHDILVRNSVPASSIVIAPEIVKSTYDESIAVSDWARSNHIHSVLVVTDDFHTRRALWIFSKRLRPLGIHVAVDAVPAREYTPQNWWQHEQGIVAFQNELLKYAYYRLRY
jgi:uncharacterized SAM-binding protein YcdF (DUF218 family)